MAPYKSSVHSTVTVTSERLLLKYARSEQEHRDAHFQHKAMMKGVNCDGSYISDQAEAYEH